MKYKIIFDTNILRKCDRPIVEVFNYALNEVKSFVKDNSIKNVALLVPELVIEERIQQRLRQINHSISDIEKSHEDLSCFKIKPMVKRIKDMNYEKLLRSNADQFLKDNKIETIKTARVSNELVIERSLKKIKPFNEKGDKGFKDTMIWLSILEDVKKDSNASNYIFCSNDITDMRFDELNKEFKECSNKKLAILPDLNSLQEHLDKELVLKLELKELHRKITEELGEYTGTITMKVNSQLKNEIYNFQNSFAHEAIAYSSLSDPQDSNNLDFDQMKITSIVEEDKGTFRVEIELKLKKKRFSDQNLGYLPIYGHMSEMVYKNYTVTLRYSRTENEIELLSVSQTYENPSWTSVAEL